MESLSLRQNSNTNCQLIWEWNNSNRNHSSVCIVHSWSWYARPIIVYLNVVWTLRSWWWKFSTDMPIMLFLGQECSHANKSRRYIQWLIWGFYWYDCIPAPKIAQYWFGLNSQPHSQSIFCPIGVYILYLFCLSSTVKRQFVWRTDGNTWIFYSEVFNNPAVWHIMHSLILTFENK